jgi:ABC-type transport system involved in cytochrome c biogenesis permease subunit
MDPPGDWPDRQEGGPLVIMELKLTQLGILIYLTMALYFLSAGAQLAGLRKTHHLFFAAGFLTAAAAWILRWTQVGHIPMQSMFEIFLTLGMVIWPVSLACQRFLRIRDTLALAGDGLLGVVILFPAGFIFAEVPNPLPPALQSVLFAPHVAVYMLAYVIMAKAALQSAGGFFSAKILDREQETYTLIRLGFPLLSAGLLLGSVWGKLAWGDWWGWDPKELWSLTCWLVYAFYFHWRYLFGKRFVRINLSLSVLGLLCILLTLLWVNLSRLFSGMHNYAA